MEKVKISISGHDFLLEKRRSEQNVRNCGESSEKDR